MPPIRCDRDLFLILALGTGLLALRFCCCILAFGTDFFAFGTDFFVFGPDPFVFRSDICFFAFWPDNDCARRFGTSFFVTKRRRRLVSRTMIRQDDDFMSRRNIMMRPRRGCPFRFERRTRTDSRPNPDIIVEKPSFVIRDVFILVQDIAVLRDRDFFGSCYNDRLLRGCDDVRRGGDDRRIRFHDDRFFDESRSFFHDDRSGTRLNDRTDKVHDVCRKLDAVVRTRRFMVVMTEGCRSEDCRCGEGGADNECLVDGLLDRVSCW